MLYFLLQLFPKYCITSWEFFSHISKTADEPKKLVKSSVERFEPKLKEPLERNND